MTSLHKIKYQLITFMLVLLAFSSCRSAKLLDHTDDKTIAEIRSSFAPDSRVAVFDVQSKRKGKNLYLYGETNIEEAKKALIEIYTKNKFNIIDSIMILPDKHLTHTFAVARVSVSNIRSEPRHSAELSTQAIMGTPVRVLKRRGNWYMVQTPNYYIGWIDREGIQLMNETDRKDWNSRPKLISLVQHGFVLKADALKSVPVSDFVSGSIFALIGESVNKDFWIVSLPDKRIGYVDKAQVIRMEDFLESRRSASTNDIIATAYQFMGAPYLWGGTSSKGMDCSGFTKTVFFLNGLIIHRDASQQINSGDIVDLDMTLSSVKPGDLLFFGTKRDDGSERINHVAIYIGSGRFIHASGNVKIESLLEGTPDYNEYRAGTLLHVRRYIGSKNDEGIISLRNVSSYFDL